MIDSKGEDTIIVATTTSKDSGSEEFDILPPSPPSKSGFLARLRHYEVLLDKKLGIETNGPARILPETRNPPNQAVMALMWASGTMNLSCFATGFLGWEFGLDLKQSILTTIFATLLGGMVTVRFNAFAYARAASMQIENGMCVLRFAGLVCNTRAWHWSSPSWNHSIQFRMVAFQNHRCFERDRATWVVIRG